MEGPRGSDTAVASGGIRLRVPVGISANNGTEAIVQSVNQEKGNGGDGDGGGGGSSCGVVGPRLELQRGSSETARVGGGDKTREVRFGVFGNNGGDNGEAVVERLLRSKKDGTTVTVRMEVIVVMLLMIVMLMMMVMVVLLLVTGKMEVKG